MGIIQQPSSSEIAAYGGEAYFVFSDIILDTLGTWKQMVVTVTNITTGETTTVRKAYSSLTPAAGSTTAVFQIDVSNIIQTYFCTNDKPPLLDSINTFSANVVQGQPVFRLDVGYEYIAASTGLIATSPTTDTTNDFTVLNATYQNDALPFLAPYTNPTNRLFLTTAPRDNDVCINDNATLTFWIDGINALRVIATPNGGPLQIGVIDITDPITTGTTQSATVGPVGINGATYATGSFARTQNTNFYTVEAGSLVLGVFTPVTEVFTFTMVECCPGVDCRMYWLNSLGGIDSYLFNGTLQQNSTPTSSRYDKPLGVPSTLFDYGPAKFDSRRATRFEARSKLLCQDDADWLVELQSSIRVCKQANVFGALRALPILVLDIETIIENRDLPGVFRDIIFIDADPIEVQQYG
jgi:hypothetical protein